MSIEKYCKGYSNFNTIGYGSYGKIYRAEENKSGYYVAIKEIEKGRLRLSNEILEKEVAFMKKIENENSVKVKDVIDSNDYFYIIMEYCEYNLETYLKKRIKKGFSVENIKDILMQLNNTLKLMTKENIIHRDLKPSNILISFEEKDKSLIKLCDYGSAKNMNATKTMSIAGTPLTMAPEILNEDNDFSKCDLWSLGIIIYFMYFKEYPYFGNSEVGLLKDINSKKKLKSIENKELNDLMTKLLKININERLSWNQYFNHPFFKKDEDKDEIIIKLKEKIKLLEEELKKVKNENKNLFQNPLQTLKNHKDVVWCLTLLNDGRLVSGSFDNSIIIYNKNTYQPNIIIKEHKDAVRSLIQLKNKILASCSYDKTIKLFNIKEKEYQLLQTLNLHSAEVLKILELSNNYLVSGSYDDTIYFCIKDGTLYKKDYSISTSDGVDNIIETKQNEIVYSTYEKINFFNFKERKNKSIIENIKSATDSFCMIKNDLLLIGGYDMIYIINVNEYKKIREINILNAGYILGICIFDSNIIITGDENMNLCKWKIEKDNISLIFKKEKAHDNSIYAVLNLGNGYVATGSLDNTIKIW